MGEWRLGHVLFDIKHVYDVHCINISYVCICICISICTYTYIYIHAHVCSIYIYIYVILCIYIICHHNMNMMYLSPIILQLPVST